MEIKLVGVSRKGKNLVKRFGSVWTVSRKQRWVLFSQLEGWLYIYPSNVSDAKLQDSLRWVHETSDENFNVERFDAASITGCEVH